MSENSYRRASTDEKVSVDQDDESEEIHLLEPLGKNCDTKQKKLCGKSHFRRITWC